MPDALDIFVFVCWFAGGFVSGVSGIGGTMFAFPFLALAIPMHALIPLSCLVCFFKDACMIAMHVRFCRFDAMPWLLLGAVPGSFAGVYLLQICSGAVLQGIVGILLLFFVYWQLYVHGGRGGGARLQPVGVACGFGAGLLGTGIALDGPPMAAFGLAVGWEPRVFLGTVSVFFMLRGIITLVLQWWHGFFTPEVLGMAMYGTPGVMLGSLAAFPVVKRINVLLFRRVLLAIIAICGEVCLVRAIWEVADGGEGQAGGSDRLRRMFSDPFKKKLQIPKFLLDLRQHFPYIERVRCVPIV